MSSWSAGRTSGVAPDPFERELAVRLAHVAAQRTRKTAWLYGLAMPLCFILIAVFRWPLWVIVVPIVAMLLLLRFDTRRSRRLIVEQVRATLLSAGRCASCAYLIGRLPADPDGCVTCPECGAGWEFDPDWGRRADVADAAAAERLNIRSDHSAQDQETIQWVGRFFGGLSGRRVLAMTDARGRMATLFFPRFPWRSPPSWDQVDPAAGKAMRREIRLLGWKKRVLISVLLGFPAVMQGWAVLRLSPAAMLGPFQILTILWVFVFFPLAIFGFLAFPLVKRPEDMATIFLRRGHCPGCATDLKNVSIGDDRARECPRCLAAWKLAAWKLDGDARGESVSGSTSPTRTPPNPQAAPRSG